MIKFLGVPVACAIDISHGSRYEASSLMYICEVLLFLLNSVIKVPVSAAS